MERARELSVEDQAPQPIVMGRHLIELGLEPGIAFGTILDECFTRQLDGEFDTLEAGLVFAREILSRAERAPSA